MSLSSKWILRPFVAAALLVVATSIGFDAVAQTPAPAPSPEPEQAELRFVGGPLWRSVDQPLNLKFLVSNQGSVSLEGFRVIVGIGERIRTRSALQAGFDGQPVVSSSALPFSFAESVPGSGSTRVKIQESTGSFATLARATEGGVYPATITLQSATGLPLAAVQVPLIYYPASPEVPLNIVTMLPLNERPSRTPVGDFLVGEAGTTVLEIATAADGWLTGYLDTLDATSAPVATQQPTKPKRGKGQPELPQPLHLALGVSPSMLEELAVMASGFSTTANTRVEADEPAAVRAREAVARLASLLGRSTVERSLLPYSFPDLPTITAELSVASLLEQFKAARDVLEEELGPGEGDEWLFPAAGRLDVPSLQQIQLIDPAGNDIFISHDSLADTEEFADGGCPEASPSFTCPIAIETAQGRSEGFVSDPGLSARLAALQLANNDRLTLQQFFAETSMIHEELPGTPDRVIQATIPSLWHPTPGHSRLLLEGLRDAPWLETLTPSEALTRSEPIARDIVGAARPLAAQPDGAFFSEAADATKVIEAYETVVPPDSGRLARLRRNLLIAQSRTLWRDKDEASAFLTGSRSEAIAEMSKIGIEGADDFTCTSRDCQLQLVLTNEATYPVNVKLQLLSPNLELGSDSIEGTYEPGNKPLTIKAQARGSGVFRLAIRLTTTDGSYLIQEKTIVIRSTNFNRVALIVTLGALTFLVLFYAVRGLRRRSKRGSDPT